MAARPLTDALAVDERLVDELKRADGDCDQLVGALHSYQRRILAGVVPERDSQQALAAVPAAEIPRYVERHVQAMRTAWTVLRERLTACGERLEDAANLLHIRLREDADLLEVGPVWPEPLVSLIAGDRLRANGIANGVAEKSLVDELGKAASCDVRANILVAFQGKHERLLRESHELRPRLTKSQWSAFYDEYGKGATFEVLELFRIWSECRNDPVFQAARAKLTPGGSP